MPQTDTLQRFIFDHLPIRGEYIHLGQTFQTIMNQHAYAEPIRRLLGEALCVAGLLSAVIKWDGRLTIQFRGKHKLSLVLAQCDHTFNMRGLVQSEMDLSEEELIMALKEGVLVIMLDSNKNGSRYQGIVEWTGNSLAESVEAYFRESEQLETKIWLSVNDQSAAGYLLQLLPNNEKEQTSIDYALTQPNWNYICQQTAALSASPWIEMDIETLLRQLYPDNIIRLFPASSVQFYCPCSRSRSEEAISLLGKEEAEDEIQKKQVIVVTCDFCNREYTFDRADIHKIFESHKPHSDEHLH